MRRGTLLWLTSVFILVHQCAAQGGGGNRGTTAKVTYAHPRTFGQWAHGLHVDPLVLVAFIAAVVSGAFWITWSLAVQAVGRTESTMRV